MANKRKIIDETKEGVEKRAHLDGGVTEFEWVKGGEYITKLQALVSSLPPTTLFYLPTHNIQTLEDKKVDPLYHKDVARYTKLLDKVTLWLSRPGQSWVKSVADLMLSYLIWLPDIFENPTSVGDRSLSPWQLYEEKRVRFKYWIWREWHDSLPHHFFRSTIDYCESDPFAIKLMETLWPIWQHTNNKVIDKIGDLLLNTALSKGLIIEPCNFSTLLPALEHADRRQLRTILWKHGLQPKGRFCMQPLSFDNPLDALIWSHTSELTNQRFREIRAEHAQEVKRQKQRQLEEEAEQAMRATKAQEEYEAAQRRRQEKAAATRQQTKEAQAAFSESQLKLARALKKLR